MTEFVLRLDLDETPGNPAAQSAKVCELLRVAGQAIGSDHRQRKGDLTVPSFDPHRGINDHIKIGSWKFEDKTRNPEG
jgi:hypothetical protein